MDLERQFPQCSSRDQIIAYNVQLKWVGTASWLELTNVTGCHSRCEKRHYSFTDCKTEKLTSKQNWSAAFFLSAEKTMIDRNEEFLVFDISDMINGIGGAMGLFLGWSVLFLIEQCAHLTSTAFRLGLQKFPYKK